MSAAAAGPSAGPEVPSGCTLNAVTVEPAIAVPRTVVVGLPAAAVPVSGFVTLAGAGGGVEAVGGGFPTWLALSELLPPPQPANSKARINANG